MSGIFSSLMVVRTAGDIRLTSSTGAYSWSGTYDGVAFSGADSGLSYIDLHVISPPLLTALDAHESHLSMSALQSLSSFTGLATLDLHGNAITGVAAGFAVPTALVTCDLSDNALTGDAVDTILAAFVSAGGINGTIDVSGTNSIPSSAGETSISTLTSRGWTVTYGNNASALLGAEPDGFAVDWTDLSVLVRDTVTEANNYSGPVQGWLTYSSPSPKWIRLASGLYQSGTTQRTEYAADGVTALGVLMEPARSCPLTGVSRRDLTNAAWAKTNITAAKTQVGIDGSSNSASSITATSDSATVLQAVTAASAARFASAFVKRLSGTGAVEMTLDGGSTWTAVTVTSSWTRVSIPTQTLANPSVGFRLATSGDAIAVDFVQCENGTYATSPIDTSLATRVADTFTIPVSSLPFSTSVWSICHVASSDAPLNNQELSRFFTSSPDTAYMRRRTGGTATQFIVSISSSLVVLLQTFTPDPYTGGADVRTAYRYASNNAALCINGGALSKDTDVATPMAAQTTFSITWEGHFKKVKFLKRSMSDAELQAW